MTYDQFAERLFAAAEAAGISPAEIYYAERDSVKIVTQKLALESYAVSSTAGLSFRGVVNGRMGYASTEALDEEAVALLIRGVQEAAALVEDPDAQEIYGGSERYAALDTYSPELAALPADAHIAAALELERQGISLHPEVREAEECQTAYIDGRVTLQNSFGLKLTHRDNLRYLYLGLMARRAERAAEGVALHMGRELAPDMQAEVAEAAAYAARMLDAEPIASGKLPAVFRKDAMGDLLDCFASAFSAEAAQKGLSLLKGREGETIAAPCVTLVDDPLLPNGFSSCPFDAEGVAAYTKNIVEGGVLKTLLHNLKTARIAGVTSTGNAAKASYAAPVHVAPSNLFLAPGTEDLPALLRRMGEGLLITELAGLHAGTNGISGDFSLSAKGFVVREGKPAEAVEQITVAGNIFALLQAIEAVGSDLYFGLGGAGSPSVLVKEIAVAGK